MSRRRDFRRFERKQTETVDFSCHLCGTPFPVNRTDAERRVARFCPKCEQNLRDKEPKDDIETRLKRIEVRLTGIESAIGRDIVE